MANVVWKVPCGMRESYDLAKVDGRSTRRVLHGFSLQNSRMGYAWWQARAQQHSSQNNLLFLPGDP